MTTGNSPIQLRGHHLLCLFGFRGEGYSAEFVGNLAEIQQRLWRTPEQAVRLVDGDDDVCRACPQCSGESCLAYNTANLMAQDLLVMSIIGAKAGETHSWIDLRLKVAQRVSPAEIERICGDCPWLERGWCQEGLRELKESLATDERKS
jgi:uncharacterized protein